MHLNIGKIFALEIKKVWPVQMKGHVNRVTSVFGAITSRLLKFLLQGLKVALSCFKIPHKFYAMFVIYRIHI
jgi:hypothetical protein